MKPKGSMRAHVNHAYIGYSPASRFKCKALFTSASCANLFFVVPGAPESANMCKGLANRLDSTLNLWSLCPLRWADVLTRRLVGVVRIAVELAQDFSILNSDPTIEIWRIAMRQLSHIHKTAPVL